MPTIREILSQTSTIQCTSQAQKVEYTVALELQAMLQGKADFGHSTSLDAPKGSVRVAVVPEKSKWKAIHSSFDGSKDWAIARAREGQGIELLASKPHLLYMLFSHVVDDWKSLDAREFANGKILHPALRPSCCTSARAH